MSKDKKPNTKKAPGRPTKNALEVGLPPHSLSQKPKQFKTKPSLTEERKNDSVRLRRPCRRNHVDRMEKKRWVKNKKPSTKRAPDRPIKNGMEVGLPPHSLR